jgi:hypothetical protein
MSVVCPMIKDTTNIFTDSVEGLTPFAIKVITFFILLSVIVFSSASLFVMPETLPNLIKDVAYAMLSKVIFSMGL